MNAPAIEKEADLYRSFMKSCVESICQVKYQDKHTLG